MKIYSKLEDKWYDFLDAVDDKLPVYKIIDPVDRIVPSFLLFLIFLIIIFILIIGSFIIIKPSYTVEVTVLSNTGLPLSGVELEVFGEDLFLTTNNEGKASFVTSDDFVDIRASKKNYLTVTETFFSNKKATLRLSPVGSGTSIPSNITILVKRKDGDLIINSELEINCDGNISSKTKQPLLGYNVFNSGCSLFEVTAKANGFKDKTATISFSDDRYVFYLDELVQKGTVFFNVSSSNGPEEDVELTLTNQIGQSQQHFTGATGVKRLELVVGRYTWSANKNSAFTNGSFELENGAIEEIDVLLSGMIDTDDLSDSEKNSLVREIAPKIIYNEEGLAGVIIIIYKDGELISSRRTAYNGEISPMRISTSDTSNYSAVIRAQGYETKLIDLIPQEIGEKQLISLRQGGAELKLIVYDDANSLVSNAFVNLKISGFNEVFEEGYTDRNGEVLIKNLPPNNYSIYATDRSNIDEANLDISLSQDEITEKEIVLITGKGSITYRFYNEENTGVNVALKAFEEVDSNYGLIADETTTREYFRINDMRVGTKIKLEITDPSFFPTETIPYSIMRGSKTINTFVRTSNLPNPNKIQLLLNGVYEDNPLEGGRREARRIIDGETYYLLFDLVLNNYDLDNYITNLTISSDDEATIENVFSIHGSQRVLSSSINGFIIDQVDGDIVNEKALQANLFNYNQQGPKSIPFIVEMNVDKNSVGKIVLNYKTKNTENESLDYSKEFVIGESFCLKDCPVFMYDNYLIHNNVVFPISEKGEEVFLGNDYQLKTIVHNLSDQDYSNAQLISFLKQKSEEYIKINDSNKIVQSLPINPISVSEEKRVNLNLINSFNGFSYVEQAVSIDGENSLNETGAENKIKLGVRNKEQIMIITSPTKLEAGLHYPLFFIGTKYRTGKRAEAHWQIKKIVDGEDIDLGLEFSGATDENGESLIPLNLTNFSPGDKIVIIAEGNDGTLPARKEIELGVAYGNEFVEIIPECLKVKVSGKEILGDYFTIDVNSNHPVTIESSCNVERRVEFITDLFVSEKSINIPANETKSITIQGKPRGNLLGVYPVQLFTDNTKNGNYLGLFDVVLKDPTSCFDLEQAIFEMKTTGKISSKVINNCYTGRKDNFYPKMDSSTRAISLEYNKPGNPQQLDFNVVVIGSAIESVTQGATQGNILSIISKEKGSAPFAMPMPIEKESDLVFTSELDEFCQTRFYDGNYTPKPNPEYGTYWGDYSNPTKPMYSMPVVEKTIPSQIRTSEEEKVEKISFVTSLKDAPSGGQGNFNIGSIEERALGKFPYAGCTGRHEIFRVPLFARDDVVFSQFIYLPIYVENYNENEHLVKEDISNIVRGVSEISYCGDTKDQCGLNSWHAYNKPYPLGQILNYYWGPIGYNQDIAQYPPFWETNPLSFYAFGNNPDLDIALRPKTIEKLSGCGNNRQVAIQNLVKSNPNLTREELYDNSNLVKAIIEYEGGPTMMGGKNFTSQERWTTNAPHFFDAWANGEILYKKLAQECPGSCYLVSEADYGQQIKGLQWFVEGTEEDSILDSPAIGFNLNTLNLMSVGLVKFAASGGDPEAFFNPFMRVGTYPEASIVVLQLEEHRVTEQFVERKAYWEKEVHMPALEGTIVNIGRYDATPVPESTNLDKWAYGGWNSDLWFDVGEGVRLDDDLGLVVPQCLQPNGFVDFERDGIHTEEGCIITPNSDSDCEKDLVWGRYDETEDKDDYFIPHYIIRPAEDPLVEYHPSGKIMYYIDQETVPGWKEGKPYVRMFLRNGHVYAEYIGLPEIESNVIDFNIIRENLLGSEYAILTVQDWINNDEKIAQNYQIKLSGPESSCIGVDGKEGQSGTEFAPNLLFDWTWENITSEQCNIDSAFSTYCDATQFTISMFKRLNEIDQLAKNNLIDRIPEKVAFYSFLIKDNYSNEFLEDFVKHYTTEFLAADTEFVTTHHKLIEEERYNIEVVRDSGNTELPYGGIYRVEIDLDYDTSNNTLFFAGETSGTVRIVLTPIKKAPNYNIFYELAINGDVGKETRSNYGINTIGDNLKLTTDKQVYEFNNAMKTIDIQKNNSIADLSTGTIFTHDSYSDTIYLLPSQPTPVTMSIKSDNGKVNALYSISNDYENNFTNQKWKTLKSTIGRNECLDFSGEKIMSYDPLISGDNYKLSWNGYLNGTLTLSTVFFTPKGSNYVITPINEEVIKFESYDNLQNATSIILSNFDEKGNENYDTLKSIIDGIKEEKYCISKDEDVKIWWNREYLDILINEINKARGYSCE